MLPLYNECDIMKLYIKLERGDRVLSGVSSPALLVDESTIFELEPKPEYRQDDIVQITDIVKIRCSARYDSYSRRAEYVGPSKAD